MDPGAGEVGMTSMVLLVLIGAVIIGGVFFLLWWTGMPYGVKWGVRGRMRALTLLDDRYARGEIPKAEYERQRRELETGLPTPKRGV